MRTSSPSPSWNRQTKYGLACLLLAVASGCASGDSPPVAPPPDPPVVLQRTRLNVPYATADTVQRLDLYLPATGNGPFPVVLWIHGGYWEFGSKDLDSTRVPRSLTTRGYAVAAIGYRVATVARYPGAVQDVKAAVRFLRANATAYGLRADRIGAWGESAGGHLAAMLGLSGGASVFEDAALGNASQSSRVQAVVNWYGPAELLTMDADDASVGCPFAFDVGWDSPTFGAGLWLGARLSTIPARAREASPVTWASSDDAPMLIQHGRLDCIVSVPQSRRLRDAMRAVMDVSRVEYDEFPSDGHGGGTFDSAPNVNRIVAFLDRWLK
jgi:acetyl esterase/lipase